MFHWKNRTLILTCIIFFGSICGANSQMHINGPDCVTKGLVYQYIFEYKRDSLTGSMQICVEGGKIIDSAQACYNGILIPQAGIVWDDSATQGRIMVSSSLGNDTLEIGITKPLSGGNIDSLSKFQTITADSIPPPIYCSAAQDGNCSPVYYYQWQQSTDNLTWNDIAGAVNKDLLLNTAIQQTMYYRRKVKEDSSDVVVFSDVAILLLPQ